MPEVAPDRLRLTVSMLELPRRVIRGRPLVWDAQIPTGRSDGVLADDRFIISEGYRTFTQSESEKVEVNR